MEILETRTNQEYGYDFIKYSTYILIKEPDDTYTVVIYTRYTGWLNDSGLNIKTFDTEIKAREYINTIFKA